ncbi:Hypothetical protein A7982_10542 [Minicystis rosea]|nr:Hypothetical protein A7982_10542 [Minicystis rosea]
MWSTFAARRHLNVTQRAATWSRPARHRQHAAHHGRLDVRGGDPLPGGRGCRCFGNRGTT